MEKNILIILLMSVFFSCSNDDKIDPKNQLTDYSVNENWMYKSPNTDKKVDLFYLYPSAYTGDDNYCAVTDEGMRAGASMLFEDQASAFMDVANAYAPYYRQLNAVKHLALSIEEQEKEMTEVPVADCIKAFDYYISNINNGRPFILAGHSQGSNVLIYILDYIEKSKPELLDRMVAAYIIGYSVTTEYLAAHPKLKFATGATDTGVIVSWNTEAPGVTGANPVLLDNAIAINPISWTRDETLVPASDNLGSRIKNESGIGEKVLNLADARVNQKRGVVECSTVNPEDYAISFMPIGVYHGCDYSFYYYNLKANAQARVNAYLEKK